MHISRFETIADSGNERAGRLLVDRLEAAFMLSVSPGTVDNLRIRGELPSVKVASRRLYDPDDLRAYINARKGVTA
jgi:hypothetical protein